MFYAGEQDGSRIKDYDGLGIQDYGYELGIQAELLIQDFFLLCTALEKFFKGRIKI